MVTATADYTESLEVSAMNKEAHVGLLEGSEKNLATRT
jgi:hypothetical protein